MPVPKLVAFDIGKVLVNFEPRNIYAQLLSDPPEDDPLWTLVHDMNARGDLGNLQVEVESLAAQHPEAAHLIRPWFDRWDEMFTPAIPGTAGILLALRGNGVRLAALTNFAADTFLRAQGMYPFLRAFDIEVVSG
ncbi:MAG: HAD family hydrolase, partial [Alphaproteobacteria bacterium]